MTDCCVHHIRAMYTTLVVQVANFAQVAPSDAGLKRAARRINTVLSQTETVASTALHLFQSMSGDCRSLVAHASLCAINPDSIISVVRLIAPIMQRDVVAHLRAKLGHPTVHMCMANVTSDEIEIMRAAELSSGASLVCRCSLVCFSINCTAPVAVNDCCARLL